jgi:hypothetical protein
MQDLLKEEIIQYLVKENYVDNIKSAGIIYSSMSQEWLSYIIEKKLSSKEIKAAYLKGRQEGATQIISNAPPIREYTPKEVLKMSGRRYMDKLVDKDVKKAVKAVRKKETV